VAAAALLAPRAAASAAQPETRTDRELPTRVTIELITGREGVGLQAQRWHGVFEQLGVPFRVRMGRSGEKPSVTETATGRFREVHVIGQLDRSGRVVLPDHSFTAADGEKLGKYLKELETFGRQGRPEGKPLWGLNEPQFTQVYETLSQSVAADVKGLRIREAVAKIDLPASLPVRFSADADRWLTDEEPETTPVRQEVKGFSKGTALAIVLNDYGLGFYPLRKPAGTIELVVEPVRTAKRPWPVGWEPKESLPKTAPALYEMVPVDLDDVALLDVLNAVSVQTKIPIRFDHYRIEAFGVDPATARVSYPPKKTSLSILVRNLASQHKLLRDVKIDEQGHPFLWITPNVPRPAKK
jgi:hypothetical protein